MQAKSLVERDLCLNVFVCLASCFIKSRFKFRFLGRQYALFIYCFCFEHLPERKSRDEALAGNDFDCNRDCFGESDLEFFCDPGEYSVSIDAPVRIPCPRIRKMAIPAF